MAVNPERVYDADQQAMMAEECILVDVNDNVTGSATKLFCHKMENISRDVALHRAFSVLLFNSKGEMLLQQRSDEKITFPAHWTNTCCSHPLYRPEEMNGTAGAKAAALRKLDHELGIAPDSISPDELHFLTRIIYKAPSDGEWGEHELDHILLVQKDVQINVNASEIKAVRYVTPDELKQLLADKQLQVSPWFNLICEKFFFNWWADLDRIVAQKGLGDEKVTATIHALTAD